MQSNRYFVFFCLIQILSFKMKFNTLLLLLMVEQVTWVLWSNVFHFDYVSFIPFSNFTAHTYTHTGKWTNRNMNTLSTFKYNDNNQLVCPVRRILLMERVKVLYFMRQFMDYYDSRLDFSFFVCNCVHMMPFRLSLIVLQMISLDSPLCNIETNPFPYDDFCGK